MIPEISIIIPIYNKATYFTGLKECLLRQSFTQYECIFVDDGSTDGSGEMCDCLCRSDKRFSVYHIENAGVSNARNVALDHVIGRYITFIDADDTFNDRYLENLYECISKTKARLVITSSMKVWSAPNEMVVPIDVPFKGYVSMDTILPQFMRHQLGNGIYGYCWGKIMERNLVMNNRFDTRLSLAEDLAFYLSVYPKIDGIYFDNHRYYYYLQEAINSSMQKPDWKIDYLAQLKIYLKMKSFLQSAGYLTDENLELLSNRIYDYVYFSIYYASRNTIREMCKSLKVITAGIQDHSKHRSIRQRVVLSAFNYHAYWIIELMIRGIRIIKRDRY